MILPPLSLMKECCHYITNAVFSSLYAYVRDLHLLAYQNRKTVTR